MFGLRANFRCASRHGDAVRVRARVRGAAAIYEFITLFIFYFIVILFFIPKAGKNETQTDSPLHGLQTPIRTT